jgi:hypothetical protein
LRGLTAIKPFFDALNNVSSSVIGSWKKHNTADSMVAAGIAYILGLFELVY